MAENDNSIKKIKQNKKIKTDQSGLRGPLQE